MKRVTVHSVSVKPASLFSEGFGYDDDDNPVRFIGHTTAMSNINKDIQSARDDFAKSWQNAQAHIELPAIYLEAWQEI